MKRRAVDRPFLILVVILASAGFFIFLSASLGLLARSDAPFQAVALKQLIFLAVGFLLLFIASRVDFRFWNKYSFYIYTIAILATLLVFIPGLGFEHGGARRWISIGPFTSQPAELLKFGFVVYLATWLAGIRERVRTFKLGVLPVVILLTLTAIPLGLQPDYGTIMIIFITGITMFIVAGGLWKHLLGVGLVSVAGLAIATSFRPYIRERIFTFLNPASDPLGASYQVNQSLISIGSGKLTGRGFGQSVQKFQFLPEPIGDSIFAVFAEEWGFIGAIVLIALFLALGLRGYKIATKAPTLFARYTVVGIVTLILVQSLINMASMLGIFPLSGMPLLFVSQGGSALLVTLASIGIVLNISKYPKDFKV